VLIATAHDATVLSRWVRLRTLALQDWIVDHQFSTSRYLVIPRFVDKKDVDALLGRAKQLLDDFSLDDHPLVRFLFGITRTKSLFSSRLCDIG